jgi:Tfp pilus assembly protein PilN
MRYVVLAAAFVSLTVCLFLQLTTRSRIRARNAEIVQKRRELQPLASLAAEVQEYRNKKDELQRRIDLINLLKMHQAGPSAAMKKVLALDPSGIESIAIDGENLIINRRSGG